MRSPGATMHAQQAIVFAVATVAATWAREWLRTSALKAQTDLANLIRYVVGLVQPFGQHREARVGGLWDLRRDKVLADVEQLVGAATCEKRSTCGAAVAVRVVPVVHGPEHSQRRSRYVGRGTWPANQPADVCHCGVCAGRATYARSSTPPLARALRVGEWMSGLCHAVFQPKSSTPGKRTPANVTPVS